MIRVHLNNGQTASVDCSGLSPQDEATLARQMEGCPLVHSTEYTPGLSRGHAAMAALRAAQQLHERALPKFNWGASALDSEAVRLLNEVPGQVRAAIALIDYPQPVAWLRDVDGTGSLHPCHRDDPGAIAVYTLEEM